MAAETTFGTRCAIAILEARQQANQSGRQFMRSDIALIIDRLDAERKPKREKRETPWSKMTDDEFIEALEAEPHLQGVDVKREIGKCAFHFKGLGIKPSRMRIIKWLNKADAILQYSGTGQTSRKPVEPNKPHEPLGWREWVRENASNPTWADGSWAALSPEAQKYISEQLSK
jgi:hypothetical protein